MNAELCELADKCNEKAEQLVTAKWSDLIEKEFGCVKSEHFQSQKGHELRLSAIKMIEQELSDLGFTRFNSVNLAPKANKT